MGKRGGKCGDVCGKIRIERWDLWEKLWAKRLNMCGKCG